MSRAALIAFTERGCRLAARVAEGLAGAGWEAGVCGPERFAAPLGLLAYESLEAWTAEAWAGADALVFVGAAGIAVRAIAPHVRDKFSDPAVVSVDEAGRFAVPLLSGHVGGANDLARLVAGICGGQAAVSTATDVNGLFAVDEWARKLGLAICERELAKEVSAALLADGPVGFASDFGQQAPFDAAGCDGGPAPELGVHVTLDETSAPFARTLHLLPRVTLGVGCRRGTDARVLERAVEEALSDAHVPARAVAVVASIDVKADEPALRALAHAHGWELRFHAAEELAAVPGEFASSGFVRQTVGVDNVCERAACAAGARLLAGKRAQEGTTVAVAYDQPASAAGSASPPRLFEGFREKETA